MVLGNAVSKLETFVWILNHISRSIICSLFTIKASYFRVRTGPGKPGKSWNFIMAFSRTGKSWKKATGPGKFWKSVKLN